MKSVRCAFCGLLTAPTDELGNLKVAVAGNHEPREVDGFALSAETPVCAGSECLGVVVRLESSGDFTVIGLDTDGSVLCRDTDTGEVYNCGETLEQFGTENLFDEERIAVGLTPTKETTQGLHEDVGDGPECEEIYRDDNRI